MGRFESRRAELEKKGGALAAICVDPADRSQAFAKKLGLGFPILSDPDGATIRAFGVQHEGKKLALPSVFVVAPDGKIAWRKVSETVFDRPTEDEVIAAVARATGK